MSARILLRKEISELYHWSLYFVVTLSITRTEDPPIGSMCSASKAAEVAFAVNCSLQGYSSLQHTYMRESAPDRFYYSRLLLLVAYGTFLIRGLQNTESNSSPIS